MRDEAEVRSQLLNLHARARRSDDDAFLAGEIHALLWVLNRVLVEPAQEAARRAGEWARNPPTGGAPRR